VNRSLNRACHQQSVLNSSVANFRKIGWYKNFFIVAHSVSVYVTNVHTLCYLKIIKT